MMSIWADLKKSISLQQVYRWNQGLTLDQNKIIYDGTMLTEEFDCGKIQSTVEGATKETYLGDEGLKGLIADENFHSGWLLKARVEGLNEESTRSWFGCRSLTIERFSQQWERWSMKKLTDGKRV